MTVTSLAKWQGSERTHCSDPNTHVVKKGVYRISKEIVVPESETLIIEAGTKFLFTKHVGILVHGVLKAIGTEQEPIVFTTKKHWKNISFLGDQDFVEQSILEYCHIIKGAGIPLSTLREYVVTPYDLGVLLKRSNPLIGGGLLIAGLNPVIRNCKISGCHSALGGGIFATHTSLKLTNCTIEKCSSYQSTIIETRESEKVVFDDVRFIGNLSEAIEVNADKVNFTNCEISENLSIKRNLIQIIGSTVTIANCKFSNNSSHNNDIISIHSNAITNIRDCVFDSNHMSEDNPGTLICVNVTKSRKATTVNLSNIKSIESHKSNYTRVIEINRAKECNLDGIHISPLIANGSIIQLEDIGKTTLKNLKLTNCTCRQKGSPLHLSNLKQFHGENLTITGNKSQKSAGGICANNCEDVTIKNSRFANNQTENKGGAIYAKKTNNLTLQETTIEENKAEKAGGAIALNNTNLTQKNCKIQNNKSGNEDRLANFQKQENDISFQGNSTCKTTDQENERLE